jgi:hypothetical protein
MERHSELREWAELKRSFDVKDGTGIAAWWWDGYRDTPEAAAANRAHKNAAGGETGGGFIGEPLSRGAAERYRKS